MENALNQALESCKRINILIAGDAATGRLVAVESDKDGKRCVNSPVLVPQQDVCDTIAKLLYSLTTPANESAAENKKEFIRCHCIHKASGRQCVLPEGHDGKHKLED